MIVKSPAAAAQLEAERQAEVETASDPTTYPAGQSDDISGTLVADGDGFTGSGFKSPTQQTNHRFFGSVDLDAELINRDIRKISEAIIQHLVSQMNATVRITVEIEAELPDGASEQLIRTVTENASTLKFSDFGFEIDEEPDAM